MGYKTRCDFYNSIEWKKIKRLVIDRATKEDGFVYDELNGERIILKGDIIVHHLVELDDNNFNDVAVSLNPDNLRVVSFAHHNALHQRYGGFAEKKVYWVYGSGDAYPFIDAHRTSNDLLVDIGRIRKAVTFSEERSKATDAAVFAARDAVLDIVYTRRGKWQNAWVVAKEVDERMANKLGAYLVEIE